jgi:hypothetical protein
VRERDLQKDVAEWLRWVLPPDVYWTAIPGGDRHMTRAPGYRSGAPDLLFIILGRACLIELKTRSGRVQPCQHEARDAIIRAGGWHAVCRSIEDVEGTLRAWGVNLRIATGRAA